MWSPRLTAATLPASVMQRGSLSLADWLSKMESSPSALGRKNMLFQLAEGLNYLHAR